MNDLKQFHLQNDAWQLGEDIPNADLFFSNVWLKTFVTTCDQATGRSYNKILCRYEGYHLWFYFGAKDGNEVAEHIAERIVSEPGYAKLVNENIIRTADCLRAYVETIPQTGLSELTNEKLWEIYATHLRLHSEYYEWCWIPVAADMFHNNLTRRVKEYLRTLQVPADEINSRLVALTQPTEKSLIFIEQEELLQIAILVADDLSARTVFETLPVEEIMTKLPESIKEKIQAHCQKYYYTKHLWVSGEYAVNDYVYQIKEVFETGIEPREILAKQYEELTRAKTERDSLMEKFAVSEKWKTVLTAFGDFMITKIYRRYAQLLAVHHMSAILKEIAKRQFITEKQIRFALPEEIKAMLFNNLDCSAELLKRTKRCVWYADKNSDVVWTGAEADEIFSELEEEVPTDVTELRGETGCAGYAKGPVRIIIRAEDMAKMNPGDILVSIATDPDIVPAMKKAGGIVTEQGGVTSHAAIVSRELGIPCVIGTKIATRVLKDGDMVEVNASQGIVTKLS